MTDGRRRWLMGAGALVLAPAVPLAALWLRAGDDGAAHMDGAMPSLPPAPGSGHAAPPPLPAGLRELAWNDLLPPAAPGDATAQASAATAARIATLRDDDPEAQALLRELQERQRLAPARADLDGAAVRLTGYVVPLEFGWQGVREFLLVPYYGACIHSPPPPPNQIVHVRAEQRIKGLRAMAVAAVSGTLRVQAVDSAMGQSGYQLEARTVQALQPPRS